MAMRRPPSLCLFCLRRQAASVDRKRRVGERQRVLHTPAHAPDDALAFEAEECGSEFSSTTVDGEARTVRAERRKISVDQIDEAREAALSLDALWKQKDIRLEVLSKLSNPWPDVATGRQYHVSRPARLPEANAALVPHETFRENVKKAMGPKAVRLVLRKQLLRCERPKDILRIVAVAMQTQSVAENLSVLHEPIMRAAYRCRQSVSDPEVFRTLDCIITRFHYAGVHVDPQLQFMALKFAARSRSLPWAKKYLRTIRERGMSVTSHLFRSVIAKFSIGHRGLGEIRNGRWRRQELSQVLTGFDDCKDLPKAQQYHLGSFLDRTDWQMLHGYIAVLARCKQSEAVWREWELWTQSVARTEPKHLIFINENGMTSRKRGDYWFVEQMAHAGDLEKAWKILDETGIELVRLKTRVKDMLLEGVEHASQWSDDLTAEMLDKCDRDLTKIEQAFGVKWIPGQADGQGYHEMIADQEDVLDRMGEENWKLNEEYGYPWEDVPIVSNRERPLHQAVESAAI